MTTDIAEIKDLLSHKHILLDNNVITRASDHPRAFRPFLKLLNESECKPIIIPLIKFEYLRGAHSVEHKERREALLEILNPYTLPQSYTDEKIDLAIKIANCYAQRDLRTPNVVDCALAAQLLQFKDKVFLATTNHKDFPTFLFNRIGVFTVDTEKDVIPIGIYSYDESKSKSLDLLN